jgi:hypothetical protein
MFVTKVTNMIKLLPSLQVDVILPLEEQCLEDAKALLEELGVTQQHVSFVRIPILANAPATRYDFPYTLIKETLGDLQKYTHVYINDPLMFSHYKTLFHLAKAKPKFVLQTHFLDSPVAQVVDPELSYWHRTVEACSKSDLFLWHCKSMEKVFKQALETQFKSSFTKKLMKKSGVFKDGYSISEIRKPVEMSNLRFDIQELKNKTVVWVPNRIGGLGKSFDYTNNGKFLFESVPELWKNRQDFVVVAGNPNQKISNDEISKFCPAYQKLVPGALNRDEYRWLSQRADIVVGLYTNDTNGGLASLESIEFNAIPLFPDVFEYQVYFQSVNWPKEFSIKQDLSNIPDVLSLLLDNLHNEKLLLVKTKLQEFIRQYAAYENTTEVFMKQLSSM